MKNNVRFRAMPAVVVIAAAITAGFPAGVLAQSGETAPVIDEDELSGQVSRFIQLDLMLDSGMPQGHDDVERIQEYSNDLEPFYRDTLYDRYRAPFAQPILLNLATGGVGSFLEGDYISGSIAQGTLVIGYGLLLYGGLVAPEESREAYFTASSVSGVVSIAAGIAGPIIHGIITNNRLDESLGR